MSTSQNIAKRSGLKQKPAERFSTGPDRLTGIMGDEFKMLVYLPIHSDRKQRLIVSMEDTRYRHIIIIYILLSVVGQIVEIN